MKEKIDVKQLRSDLTKLSPQEFKAKYHTSIEQWKGLSDEQLEERASKVLGAFLRG